MATVTLGYIRVVTTADQRAQKKAAEEIGKPAHWVDESGVHSQTLRKHGFKDHINVGVSSFSLLLDHSNILFLISSGPSAHNEV